MECKIINMYNLSLLQREEEIGKYLRQGWKLVAVEDSLAYLVK